MGWTRLATDYATQPLVRQWLVTEGIVTRDVWRVDVEIIDCPVARVYRYAKDESGQALLDPDNPGRLMHEKPVEYGVRSLPPGWP